MATYDTTPFSYDPAYGGIPNLPPYTTDKQSTLGTDVQANLVKNLPNYMSLVGKQSQNIGDNLRGVVGEDVTNNLASRAAEWGTATGSPLSQAAATNFLSRYGLTSQAMKQLGGQQLIAQMGATPVQQTSDGSHTSDLAAQQAVYKSAPVPSAAAAASLKAAQAGMAAGRGGVAARGDSGYSPMNPASPTAGMGYGGGGGYTPGAAAAAAAAANPYAGGAWDSSPTPGSSIFGGLDYGSAGTGDMFDSSGLATAYGSMPDYSAPGVDPIGAALGMSPGITDPGMSPGFTDLAAPSYGDWMSEGDWSGYYD